MAETTKHLNEGMSEFQRVFLGWDQPAIYSAAAYLCSRYQDNEETDLSETVVVTPGGRANRIFLAALVQEAEKRNSRLVPPTLCTPGSLAGELLIYDLPAAGSLIKQLAWVRALKNTPIDDLQVLLPEPPAANDHKAWSSVASLLQRVHSQLAAEMLLPEDVPQQAARIPDFTDEHRWQVVALVQQGYKNILRSWGYSDPDLARMDLVNRGFIAKSCNVFLLGIPELNKVNLYILRNMPSGTVVSLVYAPEEYKHAFNEYGLVDTEYWLTSDEPDIADEIIIFADDPLDQANHALGCLAEMPDSFTTQDITVGTADTSISTRLKLHIESEAGLTLHNAAGIAMKSTGPYRLLKVVADFIEDKSYADYAALVRHPDVESYVDEVLRREDRWCSSARRLSALDEYHTKCLPAIITEYWRKSAGLPIYRILTDMHRVIVGLLGELIPGGFSSNGKRPLHEWMSALRDFLLRCYGNTRLNRHDPTDSVVIESILLINNVISEICSLSDNENIDLPSLTSAEAVRYVMQQVSGERIAEDFIPGSIDLLGWLELHLDPAPALVVTGMNEGCVPDSYKHDLFLPATLRTTLGLPDNHSRFARDAYLLTALVHSRKYLKLVTGRFSAEGDPLQPSRLLLRSKGTVLAQRLLRFTNPDVSAATAFNIVSDITTGDVDRFINEPVIDAEIPDTISVTAFRSYLASPYTFYLEHILKLREQDDAVPELDAMSYGSLIHAIMERFARSDVKDSMDPEQIRKYLLEETDKYVNDMFGKHLSIPLWLQVEIARKRLESFAGWQAKHRKAGWKIYTEPEWVPEGGFVEFPVDGSIMKLRGRIDRIDIHEVTGQLYILDYKTGDTVEKPRNTHIRKGEWCDLQLPLYRLLAASLGVGDDTGLAYIAVEKAGTSIKHADFSSDEIEEAIETARSVIRNIRTGSFTDIGDSPPDKGIFASLCNVGIITDDDPLFAGEKDDA